MDLVRFYLLFFDNFSQIKSWLAKKQNWSVVASSSVGVLDTLCKRIVRTFVQPSKGMRKDYCRRLTDLAPSHVVPSHPMEGGS